MKQFGGFDAGRPPNGSQAHDMSRELEFDRPAHVGATPFGDRPASKPRTRENSIPAPFGGKKEIN